MKLRILRVFISSLILITLYFIYDRSIEDYDISADKRSSNKLVIQNNNTTLNKSEEISDEYLVSSSKCHLIFKDPMDASTAKFVKKYPLESCTKSPLLSRVIKMGNGSFILEVDSKKKRFPKLFACCWSSISRTKPGKPLGEDFDSKFDTGHCEDFEKRVQLPGDVETVMVSCRRKGHSKSVRSNTLYENIHAFVNPTKVQDRLNASQSAKNHSESSRKLSVLVLGIDSVSRLNFLRSMPKTEQYLRDTGWHHFQGYNKMGDNTFPNLMAILTGQNSSTAYAKCKPTQAYGLDNCPFLWRDFKQAGYVTAYGEDWGPYGTFNYLKTGFVDPPTDYYLRPYILATENLLPTKKTFGIDYCTGPRLAFDRIFDYAVDFANTYSEIPYFGFFWVNSINHNDMNGISAVDTYFQDMLRALELQGTFNDTMIIFLSDHGARWGEFRVTPAGWYEERLPFIYLRVPEWFSQANDVTEALKINQHRLTSPFDLYETLTDVLKRAQGSSAPSSGCPTCHSLFRPVQKHRSCEEAGITSHWCACTPFIERDPQSSVAERGIQAFLEYTEDIVRVYKNKQGERLCSSLQVLNIFRFHQVFDSSNSSVNFKGVNTYFYFIETAPGGGLFEFTVRFDKYNKSEIIEEEIGRVNLYDYTPECISTNRKYCHCIV